MMATIQTYTNEAETINGLGDPANTLSNDAKILLNLIYQRSREQRVYLHDLIRRHPGERKSILDSIRELLLNQYISHSGLTITVIEKEKIYLSCHDESNDPAIINKIFSKDKFVIENETGVDADQLKQKKEIIGKTVKKKQRRDSVRHDEYFKPIAMANDVKYLNSSTAWI